MPKVTDQQLAKDFELPPHALVRDVPVPGELLNDEIEFAGDKALDPHKTYRVRYSWKGREFLGEWKD